MHRNVSKLGTAALVIMAGGFGGSAATSLRRVRGLLQAHSAESGCRYIS